MVYHELSLLQAGDEAAWRALNRKYRLDFILWCCRAFKTNTDEANDIFQETLIVLHRLIRRRRIRKITGDLTHLLHCIGMKQYLIAHRERADYKAACEGYAREAGSGITYQHSEEEVPDEDIAASPRPKLMKKCLETLSLNESEFLLICLATDHRMDVIAEVTGLKNRRVAVQKKFKIMRKLENRFRELMQNAAG